MHIDFPARGNCLHRLCGRQERVRRTRLFSCRHGRLIGSQPARAYLPCFLCRGSSVDSGGVLGLLPSRQPRLGCMEHLRYLEPLQHRGLRCDPEPILPASAETPSVPASYAGSALPAGPAAFGLGIGLPICREIVDRHGGSIAVTSRPGETCFTVVLPVRQGEDNDPAPTGRET